MKRTQDRADLIAYLRTLSASPAALPTQEEIDAAQPDAGGEAGEGGAQPEGAAPEGTAPEGTAPGGTAPAGGEQPTEAPQPGGTQQGALPADDLEQRVA